MANSKKTTRRATSAIWRIFAELDKPKRTLSKMNLTSMQVSTWLDSRIPVHLVINLYELLPRSAVTNLPTHTQSLWELLPQSAVTQSILNVTGVRKTKT